MATVTMADRAEMTIRRPSGEIEVVAHKSVKRLNDILFAQIVKATAAAGKGEVLSYNNITKEVETGDDNQKMMDDFKKYDTSATRKAMAAGERNECR